MSSVRGTYLARVGIALAIAPITLAAALQLGFIVATAAVLAVLAVLFIAFRPAIVRARLHARDNRFEPELFIGQATVHASVLLAIGGHGPRDPRSAATKLLRMGLVEGRLIVDSTSIAFSPYDTDWDAQFKVKVPKSNLVNLRVDVIGRQAALAFETPDGRTAFIQTVRPDALRVALASGAGAK
ncbi:MAG: hypothetical protein QOG43_1410 [Actinomycetota bacterium]|jgi:hypothetical protein|nr:hypothetical protein [Actinomycetota bacterium]